VKDPQEEPPQSPPDEEPTEEPPKSDPPEKPTLVKEPQANEPAVSDWGLLAKKLLSIFERFSEPKASLPPKESIEPSSLIKQAKEPTVSA